MTKLLIRLFIKDKDSKSSKTRQQYGRLSSVVGIVTNSALGISKLILGLIIGSIAIIADGINNISDASTSIVTLLGFKFAALPPDKEHPYGHQRVEYVVGLVVAIFIVFVGLNLIQSSISKIINPTKIEFSLLIIVVLIISILVKLWQVFFYRKIGKTINSKTITVTAFDSLSDVIATSVILVGIFVFKLTGFNVDGYLGLIIALFIIASGIVLIKDTTSPLLGEAPTSKYIKQITKHLNNYSGVLGFHDLIVHNYGPNRTFVTVDVEVDRRVDIMQTHEMIDQIEDDFRKKKLGYLVIHIDPVDTLCPLLIKYRHMLTDILAEIDQDLSFHDLRFRGKGEKEQLIVEIVIAFESSLVDEEIKNQVLQKMQQEEADLNISITVERSNII